MDFLRNVVKYSVACLAAMTMFASCEELMPEETVYAVTDVTVSPSSVTVECGKTQQFTATVEGDAPKQDVTWSLSGANKSGTTLSSSGLLTVAADETATKLTVTATSVQDNSYYGTASVKIGGSNSENNGKTGFFTKANFVGTKDYLAFFPKGGLFKYAYSSQTYSDDRMFAKPNDGSFIAEEDCHYENDISLKGKTDHFLIWSGSNYYSIHHQNDALKAGETTYWKEECVFVGEDLLDNSNTNILGGFSLKVGPNVGSVDVNVEVFGILPWSKFITSDDCEYVVYEKDTTILGISCKKYVRNLYDILYSYYVLDNGFCLKYANNNPLGSMGTEFEISEAELNVANYDYVVQNYYRGSKVYSNPVPRVAEMVALVQMRTKEWFNPEPNNYVKEWTAGGINYMTCSREFRKGGVFLHTYSLAIDFEQVTTEELNAYFALVETVPDMTVKFKVDTDDPAYRAATRDALYQTYPGFTEAQIEDLYRGLVTGWDTYRQVEFSANSDKDHPGLFVGDSYDYIAYNLKGFSIMKLITLEISWVRVIYV